MTYRITWEALEDEEIRKQFVSGTSSKFRQLPDLSEDIEKEWLLFRSAIILSAAGSCERKRLRVAGDSEKRTPWWNQEVKEALRAKKDAFKAGYRTDHRLICNPSALWRKKRQLRH